MKKSTLLILSPLTLATLALSGCATMFSGTTQTIHIQAIDANTQQIVPDAACTVSDNKGHVYYTASNPGNVIVEKSQGPLSLRCTAKGYKQSKVASGESFNAWTVADVLFWPGAIVDAASGAYSKYPSYFTALMQPENKRAVSKS